MNFMMEEAIKYCPFNVELFIFSAEKFEAGVLNPNSPRYNSYQDNTILYISPGSGWILDCPTN